MNKNNSDPTVTAHTQILTNRLGGHPFVHLLKANLRMMSMAAIKFRNEVALPTPTAIKDSRYHGTLMPSTTNIFIVRLSCKRTIWT